MKMRMMATAFCCVVMAVTHAQTETMRQVVDRGLEVATSQALLLAENGEIRPKLLPQNFDGKQLHYCSPAAWVSGFFPGVLWYLYENANKQHSSQESALLAYAKDYTHRVDTAQWITSNHDVGFMVNCSFGNGLRLTGDPYYKQAMIQAAKSLSTRFNKRIGCIKSWETRKGKWQYPVIIDNMLNLELLTEASKLSGNPTYKNMAVSHATVTMKNHFRPDFSCYHVVSYDTISGKPHAKNTHQGYADESAWARGQAWALYGYTMMYRETGNRKFLRQAVNVGKYIAKRLPEDFVPYWDFDDPRLTGKHMENERAQFYLQHTPVPKDASAAAVCASAYLELSQYVGHNESKAFRTLAENMLRSLSSPTYLAKPGEQGGFILKHSTGNLGKNSEVDVPLSYADYYYVEALTRWEKLFGNQ